MENIKEMQKQRESQRLPGLGGPGFQLPLPPLGYFEADCSHPVISRIISTPKSRSQTLETSTRVSNVPAVLFCKIKHLVCSNQNQKRSLLLPLRDLRGLV